MEFSLPEEESPRYFLDDDIFSLSNDKFYPLNDNLDIFSLFKNPDDLNFSSRENYGENMAEQVINNNKKENIELSEKNLSNEINVKKNSKENNKKPSNLFNVNVYTKKENRKYYRDNILDKIKRNFLNNIYMPFNDEIAKIRKCNESFFKNKIFEKITSVLVFFNKIKFVELLKLKTKEIFYSDEIVNNFSKKKELTEKFKEKKKVNNHKNKLLIKEIKEKTVKIDEIEDEKIKTRILNLNDVMEKPLSDMYKVYANNDNKYESFKTLVDDMIELEKDGKEDEKYVKKYETVAKSLLNEIEETN